ncbi:MAG: TIR domain-containing protein [Promethearchaeota archaeon]
MSHLKLNKFAQVEKLFNEFKLEEAIELLDDLIQLEGINLQQKSSYQFLKGQILIWQGKYEEAIKLGEQIFKEYKEFNRKLQSVDGLSIIIIALIQSNRFDEAIEMIKKAEELLKSTSDISQNDLKQRKARIMVTKAHANYTRGNIDLVEDCLNWVFGIRKELGNTFEVVYANIMMAYFMYNVKIRYDLAMNYAKNALSIAENMNFNHYWIGVCQLFFGVMYSGIGEVKLSLQSSMKSLTIFKNLNNRHFIAILNNNIGMEYGFKGEYDLALEYLEESLLLWEQVSLRIEGVLDSLIFVALEKGDNELAQRYFHRLENLHNQIKSNHVELLYKYNKALILKRSSRIRDKVKAEELLKQVIKIETLSFETKINALVHLCDLLITEFRLANDNEVLKEIDYYVIQLLTIAEKSHSYQAFCETFILQAKLALLHLDVKASRRFLSQAQKIAEKYGIKRLAMKISYEHDELLKQLEMWEKLKESKAPLAELIELSRLNEQIEGMVKRRVGKLPKLEAEQPVLLTIMSKDGKVLISNPFTADLKIDTTYFSEFLTSCTTFCDQILSESFDRVKFGQHTVLITAVDSFSICYMFQGQSYSARQKLLHFSEAVKKEPDIIKILQEAVNKNTEIKVNEIASLEELIYESYLSDPQQFQMPFKAYQGDEPFIFVSYSHTDRLQVYPIIDYLNRTGINIWYDEGIPVSEDWKSSIVDNLERCSAFLVFITPHIIDSEYVRKEISFALKKQKPFYSVYLKETELPSKLEFEIGDIQFMNKYLMPETEFYNKLNRMLEPVLNK